MTRHAARITMLALLAAPLGAQTLHGPMEQLQGFLGTWEVEATWSHGMTVWSRAQYAPAFNGRSIEGRVLVQDGEGPVYQRYLTLFRWDAERDGFVGHTLGADGSGRDAPLRWEGRTLISEWTEGGATIVDRTELVGDDVMRWTVTVQPPGDAPLMTLMQADWTRVGAPGSVAPVDTNRFAAGETDGFTVEAELDAPLAAVWAAWTDGEAFAAAVAPGDDELVAHIDLAVGGRFEILWDGETGSNGCQVLSFLPERMLSFSWNAPPDQAASRAQRSFVVIEFRATDDGGTHVALHHRGFGTRANWRETKAYFESAWPSVLAAMQANLGD